MSVGVPLISPVDGSRVRPSGRVGDTVQESTAPPFIDGTPEVNGESLVKVYGSPLKARSDGATSLIVMSIVVVAKPPVLVAVIV